MCDAAHFDKQWEADNKTGTGLPTTYKMQAPYIFLDLPIQFGDTFSQNNIGDFLVAAKGRTSAAAGMVVISCTVDQVPIVKTSLKIVYKEYMPSVLTVFTKQPHHDNTLRPNKFPASSYFAVVTFWGTFSQASSSASSQSRLLTEVDDGSRTASFPDEVQVNLGFLKNNLTDIILMPKAKPWKKLICINDRGLIAQESSSTMTFKPSGVVVCASAKPLEFYLYFLKGFQFSTSLQADTTVFDLCCGSGTASLAASYCGYVSVGIDNDKEMIDQCKYRMQHASESIEAAINTSIEVFDQFMTNYSQFEEPPPGALAKRIPGQWMKRETFMDRFKASGIQKKAEYLDSESEDEAA